MRHGALQLFFINNPNPEPFPKPPKDAQERLKPGIEKTRETLYIGVTKQPKQGDSRYEQL
jgi:hypothetical protein